MYLGHWVFTPVQIYNNMISKGSRFWKGQHFIVLRKLFGALVVERVVMIWLKSKHIAWHKDKYGLFGTLGKVTRGLFQKFVDKFKMHKRHPIE